MDYIINTLDIIDEYDDTKFSVETEFHNKFMDAEWYGDEDWDYETIRDFIANGDNQDVKEWANLEMTEEFYNISEMERLFDKIGRNVYDGVELIPYDYFPYYLQDRHREWGYEFPDWVVIDWDSTADNIRSDYASVTYKGTTYLYMD